MYTHFFFFNGISTFMGYLMPKPSLWENSGIFSQIPKRVDMTSQLIGSGLSIHQSNPVRAEVEC